jgi:hypothetical protein
VAAHRGAAERFCGRSGDGRLRSRVGRILRAIASTAAFRSTLARSVHQHERGFDASPSLRTLLVARPFTGDGLLRGLGNGLGSVCLQQLARVFLDMRRLHGVILLFLLFFVLWFLGCLLLLLLCLLGCLGRVGKKIIDPRTSTIGK